MILLTVPLFFPVVTALGYDPIWFGIMVVIVVQIGLISPPVGMNIFVVKNLLRHLSIADGVPRRDAVHRRAGRAAGADRGVSRPRDLAAELHAVTGEANSDTLRQAALGFDLKRLDAVFLADPFPIYRALREHDPVHRMPDGSYFLSRYDDWAAVYRDTETWSSDKKVDFRPNFGDELALRAPHHQPRLQRSAVPQPGAQAARARLHAARARRRCSRASRRWWTGCSIAPPRSGGMDLIEDFAAAIPLQLIGDMLGVPADERGPLRDWSLAILGALEPVLSAEQFARGTGRSTSSRTICAIWSRGACASRATTRARSSPS